MAQVVTKVKDLIALLQGCDPDGDVKITLDAALLYGEAEITGDGYSFDPVVDCLLSAPDRKLSDRIYIGLSDKDTEEALANRPAAPEPGGDADDARRHPGVATGAPVAVAVGLSSETYQDLLTVVKSCNLAHKERGGATTHGRLDVPGLLAMLAEDAAMTNSRPGSWEGAGIQQVLDSHGYQ